MRDRATSHFNRVLVAYEALINPQKRMIYDQLGIEGLKDKTWQLGVRSMSPEQFRFWLEEHMRKRQAEKLDELVASHGKVSAVLDISGLWFQKVVLVQDEQGSIVSQQVEPYPTGVITRYKVSHSFHVPLDSLADILEKPFPSSFKELWQEDLDRPRKPPKWDVPRAKPTLSLDCSLDGASPKRKDGGSRSLPASVLASTKLAVGLIHTFPNLPPDSPRSIGSLLAGNQMALQATILPAPMLTTRIGRGFGQNAVSAHATFVGLPSFALAPITECSLTRRLALRHSLAIGFNTGGVTWLQGLRDVFKLPKVGQVRSGFASLSYIYHPIGSAVADAEEAAGNPMTSAGQRTSRSKRTEAYTVSLNTGLLVRGVQAKFSWARTFFVGTPVGSQRPQLQSRSAKPTGVGIRLGVDTTLHITGAMKYTLRASRKVFENTVVGINVSCGGATGMGGIQIDLSWSRLGQKISLPVVVAPVPNSRMMVYSTAIPLLAYTAAELLWLRPRDRQRRQSEAARVRRALRSKTLRCKRAAEEATEVLRTSVQRKMAAERTAGGLVILAATYGTAAPEAKTMAKAGALERRDAGGGGGGGGDGGGKLVADVTIAVAALVDQGQLSLPRGVDKSKIIGFYDPAPGSEKVLWIRYLFGGLVHEVSVKGRQAITAPLRSHLVPGQT